jgi:CHAD domain-containing protein
MEGFSGKGEPVPLHVRHVAPVIIYHRLAAVRAYDRWVRGAHVPTERLHMLRISIKRFRYTLEFFREVLGPESNTLINDCKRMQDHLGDLQDAVVAVDLLENFLAHGIWDDKPGKKSGSSKRGKRVQTTAPGVRSYLEEKEKELDRLLATFPGAWKSFRSPKFNERLAASVSVL